MELSAIIEALLVASEDPLPSSEIARLIRARVAEAEDAIAIALDAEDADPDNKPELSEDLAAIANVNEDAITAAIAQLNHSYEVTGRAFLCTERAKGWKIFTRAEYADFVRQLFPGRKPSRLSGPAMETLAIIAYRQPVTKASLEAVRGVSCDGMVQKLLDRELVKIGGRANLPGRPMLYETTDLFFEHFGVKSVDELPNANELRAVKLPEPADVAEASEESGNTKATNPQDGESTADADSYSQEDIEMQLALSGAGIPQAEAEESIESADSTTDEEE